jgi:hypothetical protein
MSSKKKVLLGVAVTIVVITKIFEFQILVFMGKTLLWLVYGIWPA